MPARHDWSDDFRTIDDLMRAVSKVSDPQELVRIYGEGIDRLFPVDEWMALSRRDVDPPFYRITRSGRFPETYNPWTQKDKLPLLQGGVLGEIVYANRPRIIEDLRVDPQDPALFYLQGMRTLIALPQYDDGDALNIVIMMWADVESFDRSLLPTMLWQANLFGRATLNMVLRARLADANAALERELQSVGKIQRSMLPRKAPRIAGLGIATSYQPSQRAGGDYYDFFPLPDGACGIFIADVSGHGAPAAVLMAITHALAHTRPVRPTSPSALLADLNRLLFEGYTGESGAFVTAFYAVYSPNDRSLVYAVAGHNPPRLASHGSVTELGEASGLPLGVDPKEIYTDTRVRLSHGDTVVLYTDGITEAMNASQEQFGTDRLDSVLRTPRDPNQVVQRVLDEIGAFTGNLPAADDRTMVVVRVA